ncbi:4-oxalocrotonate tautomerase [Brevibacillus sp. SIMBA_040]|uniref:4-oxalocrotonate tautomerase n=1 Tax=unclassified Brevibacillus TaxID=2684853 RepID=UPI003978038F
MPIVQVSILQGRDKEQIRNLIEGVTAAITTSLDVRPEQVRVLVTELPPSHWGVGGVTKVVQSR